ncbi:cytochrome oxidase [Leptospira interrogans]|uniref:Cytochrome oxidase n=1 Tax=Leptospira interrogans serovar Hardjo str. Norma TaxID=1279460 RepID=A0A0M4MYG3_LEPIR|nr:cytochrome-c oxidase chain III [Leptospira interrogans]ALE41626.1 hypothetical protein G436_4495 [Leptospira interrogans serovar Hardjo str. Norma]ALO02464.1 cytochrome oxidase [Leptospira interrogans serovar Hardjo-prajitno]EKR19701.1 hypothetical protein LEP1GSC019_4712 [Leptospira interrogans serovar Pyrogenes str. 2006006960]MCD1164549.1 cytochrome oxidase [Leptospira interrogans]MCH1884678.1 cytochrome oxidase [Leptospira interrogans]
MLYMNTLIDTLLQQFIELFFYTIFGGISFAVVFIVSSLTVTGFAFLFHWSRVNLMSKLQSIFQFLLLLFIIGALGNSLWYIFLRERFYHAADVLTYFVPVIPFHNLYVDYECGGYLFDGIQMWHLRLLWIAWAIPCYGIAIFLFLIYYKKRLKQA